MHHAMLPGAFLVHGSLNLGQDMQRAIVIDRLNGVQTQAVHMEVADPSPRVIDHILPHGVAVGGRRS